MLQAILIAGIGTGLEQNEPSQSYQLIPWTSIVRAEYSQKPFLSTQGISPETFKFTVLGADIQILECFIFGGESANILNRSFRRTHDAYPVINVYVSDLLDRYLIQ